MTATLVPAEQVCSACGVLVNKLRSALSPSTVDAMIFLAKNGMLQSARSTLRGQPERFAFVPSAAIVCKDNEETSLSSHNWKQSRQTLTLMLDMKTGSHLILEV